MKNFREILVVGALLSILTCQGMGQSAPTLESATAKDASTKIVLTFDQDLQNNQPDRGVFAVKIEGERSLCYRDHANDTHNRITGAHLREGNKIYLSLRSDDTIGFFRKAQIRYSKDGVSKCGNGSGHDGHLVGKNGVAVADFGYTDVTFTRRPEPPPPPRTPPNPPDEEEDQDSDPPSDPTPPSGGGNSPTPSPGGDDGEGGGSNPLPPVLGCSNPEAGVQVQRWIRSADNEAILQLEANSLGKDEDQAINPVVTIFTRDSLADHTPRISSGYAFQTERVGRRDWQHIIDGERFFVNHIRTQAAYQGYDLTTASRSITVDQWKFELQRPVSRSILTGCDWRPIHKRECEAGTLVWRWIRSEDGGAILQLEASSRGTDDVQTVKSSITLFTQEELPEGDIPVVRQGGSNPRLEVLRFSQFDLVQIEEQEYYVYQIELGEGRPAPLSSQRNSIEVATRHFTVGDWKFNLQRALNKSVITGCK